MRFAAVLSLLLATAYTPANDAWNQPVEPFRIAGNVYYVGSNEVSSFLIATPKGLIVLDSGFAETAPMVRKNIEKLGFHFADVRILLNSHAHFDHAGGLAWLRQQTGATLVASEGDAPLLARGGKDDPQFGDRFLFEPVKADRLIRDGDSVTLGGSTLVAHITPGHTPGCTTWTMRVREHSQWLDVVFVGSPSVPSEYRLTANPLYPNAVADYRKQFATLGALPCDVFLAAHGNFFDLMGKRKRMQAGAKTNPFIDRDGYAKFVAMMEAKFEARVKAESEHAAR